MNKGKFISAIFWMFFIIGLIILISGVIICINTFNYTDKVETYGEVSRIENDIKEGKTTIYILYQDEYGQIYESKLPGYISTIYEGQEIKIYYDKNNPMKIGYKKLDFLSMILPGIGLVFFIIGGVGILVIILRKNEEKKLKQTGQKIYANYKETIINSKVSVLGQYPFVIICEWLNPKDNKIYLFRSKNIWTNPDIIISHKNITTFPVYINMDNMKKYLVDIEEINNGIIDLT